MLGNSCRTPAGGFRHYGGNEKVVWAAGGETAIRAAYGVGPLRSLQRDNSVTLVISADLQKYGIQSCNHTSGGSGE
jgi:hypothetical protein